MAVFGLTGSSNIFGTATVNIFGIGMSAVSVETGLIGSMALLGAFVGALVFGRIADKRGSGEVIAAAAYITGKRYSNTDTTAKVGQNNKGGESRGLTGKYLVTILGTSISWLLLDIAFYGTSVTSSHP